MQSTNSEITVFIGCKVKKHLSKAKVYDCTVDSIHSKSVSETKFEWEGKGMVSVLDYFRQNYSVNLRYQNGPCLVMSNKAKVPAEVFHQ